MTRTLFASSALALMLAACQPANDAGAPADAEASTPPAVETAAEIVTEAFDAAAMDAALAKQPDDAKARYAARNPAETLRFFGLEPGMTVVEGLPGGGWYSKILIDYLGEDGTLVGAHYPDDIWQNFNPDPDWIAGRIEGTKTWPTRAEEWRDEDDAALGSYTMTAMPAELEGTADAVLFIRALHNLNRFDADTGWMGTALEETFRALKPGGIVGIVQHRAPAGNSDEWAVGSNGYLKQDALIARMEAAGFVLEESSEINANPKDQPTEDDFVWRLSPTLAGTEEGTPEREARAALGESDRMTLRFRKPA